MNTVLYQLAGIAWSVFAIVGVVAALVLGDRDLGLLAIGAVAMSLLYEIAWRLRELAA